MSGVPKAIVTEDNGEISCSIEETNRIRTLLGLKPLKDTSQSKELEAVANFKAKQLADKKAIEAEELRKRIETAKDKRLLQDKLAIKTLSTVDDDADDSAFLSAADWVKRSRKKAIETPAPVLNNNQLNNKNPPTANEYSSDSLKGLKVMHSSKDFENGQDIILTLADSNILQMDEYGKLVGVNEEEDILENVNLTEEQKRIERENKKKRLRQPLYSAFDDDEFSEGVQPGAKRAILAHYDYDKQKKAGPKFEIGKGSLIDSNSIANANTAKKDNFVSLEMNKQNEINDYYTSTEYTATFKKRNTKKRVRKVQTSSGNDEENEDLGVNLEALLTSQVATDNVLATGIVTRGGISATGTSDLGSRKVQAQKQNEIDRDNMRRKQAYDNAVKNAELKTKLAFNSASNVPVVKETKTIDLLLEDSLARIDRITNNPSNNHQTVPDTSMTAEDSTVIAPKGDLGAMKAVELLNIQNKLKQNNVHQHGVAESKTGDDIIAKTVGGNSISFAALLSSEENGLNSVQNFDDIDTEGRRKDGTLIFSSTTEFTARLQSLLSDKARSHAEKMIQISVDDENNRAKKHLSNFEEEYSKNMDVDDKVAKDSDDESDDEHEMKVDGDNNQTDDQLGFLHRQPLASQSTAAALALLKGSGELKFRKELAGRAKDARDDSQDIEPNSDNNKQINIEYRDQYGRNLTKKEAFRQLCYRFHGYGPGKKKKDKRFDAMKREQKLHNSKNVVDSGTMKSLERTQQATGKAHVTIQGGSAVNSSTLTTLAANLLAKTKKHKEAAMKKKKVSNKSF